MRSIKQVHCLGAVALAGVLAVGAQAQQRGDTVLAQSGGALPELPLVRSPPGGAYTAALKAEAPPPAALKYLMTPPVDRWLPYVGVGAAHASFGKVWVDTARPQALALGRSPSSGTSREPVYTLGLIYQATQRLSIHALVAYVPLQVGVALAGGASAPTSTNTRSNDYVLRLSYQF